MPISTGFNHIATFTAELDRTVDFYTAVFDATVAFEIPASDDHPRMVALDLGGGSALNIAETTPEAIVGDRATQGACGPIDHYGVAVDSRGNPGGREATASSPPAPTSARSTSSATSGRCSSATPTAWSSKCAHP